MKIVKCTLICFASLCMGFVFKNKCVVNNLTCIDAVKKDPKTGKIYIGEPEPIDEIKDILGKILGGIDKTIDKVFGPAPIPIPVPIPVEDEPIEDEWECNC